MNASSSALRLPAPIGRWLATKSGGERGFIAVLAAAAVIALLWALLWQPLVRDVSEMRAAQPANAAALAQARRMGDEIAGLARNPGSPQSPDARAGLERVLAQQNLRSAVTQLDWQDGRARAVFASIAYDTLVVTLEALQRDAGLRVVEATLTARVEPGMVRAELVLAR